MRKNILFFVLALILSIAAAPYFGSWYNKLSPQYGVWMTSNNDAVTFAGFFVAFIFFQTLIFGFIGIRENKKWFIIPMIPVALLWLGADFAHIYIPIILAFAGFCVAWVLRKILFKQTNTTTVVNK